MYRKIILIVIIEILFLSHCFAFDSIIITDANKNLREFNSSKKHNKIVTDSSPDSIKCINIQADAYMDLQFEYNLYENSGNIMSQAGCECDGNFIYTTVWNSNDILIFDLDGNYIESFQIEGVNYLRDLAFDGHFMYGGSADNFFYKMDFSSQELIEIISSPEKVRSISYDERYDAFWVNNWDSDIYLIDRQGFSIMQIEQCPSIYGSAYDDISEGGPYLWVFSGTNSAYDKHFEQIDLNTLEFTGLAYQVSTSFNGNTGVAGGCFISDGIIEDSFSICGLIQANGFVGYELAEQSYFAIPDKSTEMEVLPDMFGELSAEIQWINPLCDIFANPLTAIDSVVIYFDNISSATILSPQPGANESLTINNILSNGFHLISIKAFNEFGGGRLISKNQWIGFDVPNAVTNLILEDNNGDAQLFWENPIDGLHNLFLSPLTGYKIIRSDGEEFFLNGITDSWVDTSVPEPRNYWYEVITINDFGEGGILRSNFELLFSENILVFEEFYDYLPEGWSVEGETNNWEQSFTNIAGNISPEAKFSWYPDFQGEQKLISPAYNTLGAFCLNLTFNYLVYDWIGGTTFGVKASTNGVDWFPIWSEEIYGNVPATTKRVMINSQQFFSDSFQFAFFFEGDSNNIDRIYLDDVVLKYEPNPPGIISGHVDIVNTILPYDIEDVVIETEMISVHPDSFGNYEFEIFEGIHNIKASLLGFENVSNYSVEVISNETTPNIDFLLNPNFWYQWNDDDIENSLGLSGGGTFQVASRFENGDLPAGFVIDGAKLKIDTENCELIFRIWESLDNNIPENLIYDQDISDLYEPNCQWTLVLEEEILVDNFHDYWIGFQVTHANNTYPVACDTGPAISEKGDWIYINDEWSQLSLISQYNINWAIEAHIGLTDEPLYGDVDMNLDIESYDAAITLQYALDMDPIPEIDPTPWEEVRLLQADVDGNNSIMAIDASLILQFVIGIITEFPVQNRDSFEFTHQQANKDFVEISFTENQLRCKSIGDLFAFSLKIDSEENAIYDYETKFLSAKNLNQIGIASAEIINGEFLKISLSEKFLTKLKKNNSKELTIFITENHFSKTIILPLQDEKSIQSNKYCGNYPNPFNPSTAFFFDIKETTNLKLNIFNIKGELVKKIYDNEIENGHHEILWNGLNEQKENVSSGVYFVRITLGSKNENRKILLLK